MSPASSGSLEVERYIGACLISSQCRAKPKRDFYPPYVRCNSVDGWAGGMPLISFANYQRECLRSVSPNPLARLAVHTHGAPLILANRYNHRKKKNYPKKGYDAKKTVINQVVDTVSVASDESSGSANSENSLPRIIKPRKRRKKDRKPPHLVHPLGQDDPFSTDSASPEIISPPVFQPFIPYNYRPVNRSFSDLETPKLHHRFEDLEDLEDVNGNQPESSCQCRYCDPCGQIWDVDRRCYSPFLTTPIHSQSFHFPDIKVDQFLIESMSNFSLQDSDKSTSSTPRPSGDLEVSTEIVTSLNGHRDLEIKFFSPSQSESRYKTENVSVNDCVNSEPVLVCEE